jgi:hypothetical protein
VFAVGLVTVFGRELSAFIGPTRPEGYGEDIAMKKVMFLKHSCARRFITARLGERRRGRKTRAFLNFACAALLGVCLVAATPTNVMASTFGWSLTISFGSPDGIAAADANTPILSLTNTSTSALLSSFDLTIGDTAQNYDFALTSGGGLPSGTGGFTTGTGGFTLDPLLDTLNGAMRSDNVKFTFTGFDPSEVFTFQTDVDPDSFDEVRDYRTVLFNNGDAVPNAVVTVTYLGGPTLTFTLPDGGATATSHTFSQSVVPGPPASLLVLLGGALVLCGRALAVRSL